MEQERKAYWLNGPFANLGSLSNSTTARRIVAHIGLIAVLAAALAQQVVAAVGSEPQTIGEGLRAPVFRDAYRRAFAPYLGLQWVSKPVLEEPAKNESLPDGRRVRIFVACRPHACAAERLIFAFEPTTGNGWGLITIKSEMLGDVSVDALDALLDKALGAK